MNNRPQCVKATRLECGQKVASICMHCPDMKKGTLWAMANGYLDSHGICSDCVTKFYPEVSQATIENLKKKEGIFAC